jgi:hypothetical protein
LRSWRTVIRVPKHDDLSSPWLFPPVLNPEIEGVVQINVRQQRRDYRPLRGSLYSGNPLTVFDHTRFEPLADQANDPLIGNPVFDKPEHPPVIDFIEERANVRIDDPVHRPALDSHRESIQRIVLSAPRPEAVRETEKVLFENRAQYRDDSLLHDLVLD